MGTEHSKHQGAENKKAQEAPPSNTEVKDEEIVPLPKLNAESEILTEEYIKFLSSALIQVEKNIAY